MIYFIHCVILFGCFISIWGKKKTGTLTYSFMSDCLLFIQFLWIQNVVLTFLSFILLQSKPGFLLLKKFTVHPFPSTSTKSKQPLQKTETVRSSVTEIRAYFEDTDLLYMKKKTFQNTCCIKAMFHQKQLTLKNTITMWNVKIQPPLLHSAFFSPLLCFPLLMQLEARPKCMLNIVACIHS